MFQHSASTLTPSDALPAGWEMKVDPGSGKVFFIDHVNKVTSWEDPRFVQHSKGGQQSPWQQQYSSTPYSQSPVSMMQRMPAQNQPMMTNPSSLNPGSFQSMPAAETRQQWQQGSNMKIQVQPIAQAYPQSPNPIPKQDIPPFPRRLVTDSFKSTIIDEPVQDLNQQKRVATNQSYYDSVPQSRYGSQVNGYSPQNSLLYPGGSDGQSFPPKSQTPTSSSYHSQSASSAQATSQRMAQQAYPEMGMRGQEQMPPYMHTDFHRQQIMHLQQQREQQQREQMNMMTSPYGVQSQSSAMFREEPARSVTAAYPTQGPPMLLKQQQQQARIQQQQQMGYQPGASMPQPLPSTGGIPQRLNSHNPVSSDVTKGAPISSNYNQYTDSYMPSTAVSPSPTTLPPPTYMPQPGTNQMYQVQPQQEKLSYYSQAPPTGVPSPGYRQPIPSPGAGTPTERIPQQFMQQLPSQRTDNNMQQLPSQRTDNNMQQYQMPGGGSVSGSHHAGLYHQQQSAPYYQTGQPQHPSQATPSATQQYMGQQAPSAQYGAVGPSRLAQSPYGTSPSLPGQSPVSNQTYQSANLQQQGMPGHAYDAASYQGYQNSPAPPGYPNGMPQQQFIPTQAQSMPPGVVKSTLLRSENRLSKEGEIKFKTIERVLQKMETLEPAVRTFSGRKGDKEYAYYDEMLTRYILELDNIQTDGKEDIRAVRKAAIQQVQGLIDVLEGRN